MISILLILGGGVAAFIFARSLFIMLFSMQNYTVYKERMKQLQKQNSVEGENGASVFVDKITKPVIQLFPSIKPKNYKELERDLKFIGWNRYMDPIQYRALNLVFKVIGVVGLFALYPISHLFAVIFLILGFFLFGFLFKNGVSEKKKHLFNQFPDFIRIIQGYLMAGMPLTKAVEETIPYVGEDWKYILKDFVINCDLHSVPEAIDKLCEDVNVFEVREFFALIKLNLEQGINIKECFESQSHKITEMLMESMLNQINKRSAMSKIAQAPLLICMFVAAGLPTFNSLMSLGSA